MEPDEPKPNPELIKQVTQFLNQAKQAPEITTPTQIRHLNPDPIPLLSVPSKRTLWRVFLERLTLPFRKR